MRKFARKYITIENTRHACSQIELVRKKATTCSINIYWCMRLQTAWRTCLHPASLSCEIGFPWVYHSFPCAACLLHRKNIFLYFLILYFFRQLIDAELTPQTWILTLVLFSYSQVDFFTNCYKLEILVGIFGRDWHLLPCNRLYFRLGYCQKKYEMPTNSYPIKHVMFGFRFHCQKKCSQIDKWWRRSKIRISACNFFHPQCRHDTRRITSIYKMTVEVMGIRINLAD